MQDGSFSSPSSSSSSSPAKSRQGNLPSDPELELMLYPGKNHLTHRSMINQISASFYSLQQNHLQHLKFFIHYTTKPSATRSDLNAFFNAIKLFIELSTSNNLAYSDVYISTELGDQSQSIYIFISKKGRGFEIYNYTSSPPFSVDYIHQLTWTQNITPFFLHSPKTYNNSFGIVASHISTCS